TCSSLPWTVALVIGRRWLDRARNGIRNRREFRLVACFGQRELHRATKGLLSQSPTPLPSACRSCSALLGANTSQCVRVRSCLARKVAFAKLPAPFQVVFRFLLRNSSPLQPDLKTSTGSVGDNPRHR